MSKPKTVHVHAPPMEDGEDQRPLADDESLCEERCATPVVFHPRSEHVGFQWWRCPDCGVSTEGPGVHVSRAEAEVAEHLRGSA